MLVCVLLPQCSFPSRVFEAAGEVVYLVNLVDVGHQQGNFPRPEVGSPVLPRKSVPFAGTVVHTPGTSLGQGLRRRPSHSPVR